MIEASEPQTVSADTLGWPGLPDPVRCSTSAIAALSDAAGAGMTLTTLQLDVSSKPIAEGAVTIRAQVDKRTKSIAFVSVEALSGGEMVFRAQGLFGKRG